MAEGGNLLEQSDLDPKGELEQSPEVNPFERKLELMTNLSKRTKLAKILWEKGFKAMRKDYAEHEEPDFEKYRKDFETLEYVAKNLVEDKREEDKEDKNTLLI
jgi:hypothetical protein